MTALRLLRAMYASWPPQRWRSFDTLAMVMGFIATPTFLTGAIYIFVPKTFDLSPSFTFMREHGGSYTWGLIIWSLGLLGLVCTFLEWGKADLERKQLILLPPRYHPDRLLGRWVWQLIAILWVFIGASFAVTVRFSPGTAIYVPLGILSHIVAIMARERRERGSQQGIDVGE